MLCVVLLQADDILATEQQQYVQRALGFCRRRYKEPKQFKKIKLINILIY